MRIALIADSYVPARTSVAVQMQDLAKELASQGHEPTVIVPNAELTSAWSLDQVDGVEVLRIRAPRLKKVNYLRRAIGEFALSLFMLRGLSWSPLRDVVWDGVAWYSPTIFLGPFVKVLKRQSGCRTYLILRDIFPDWALDLGVLRPGFAYRLLKLVERYQYSVADVVGVQSPANLQYMSDWARTPNRRLEVLNNWLIESESELPPGSIVPTQFSDRTVLVYAGLMGHAQGLESLILLAERMRDRSDVGFLFVGDGTQVQRLRALATEKSLGNLVFHDEIEPREVTALLAECHIGLLALDPRLKTHNIPGKFLAYLRAGLPVLAVVNAGNDLEQLIPTEGVGRVCIGDSLDELHGMAEELIANPTERDRMGARGKELMLSMFSASRAAEQLVAGLRPTSVVADSKKLVS